MRLTDLSTSEIVNFSARQLDVCSSSWYKKILLRYWVPVGMRLFVPWFTPPRRKKFFYCRISYYSNSVAQWNPQRLLLDGDVHSNPGPSTDTGDGINCRRPNSDGFVNSLDDLFGSLGLENGGLNICHYNICSITNKLDELKLLLSFVSDRKKYKPNLLLGISETFLDGSWSDEFLSVDNYTLFRADRSEGKGGGLLVYVPAHLPVCRRYDLELTGIESIWLELRYPRSRPCLFSFVYRPPSANVSYLDSLETMITRADSLNIQTIILGDFNFNLLQKSSSRVRYENIFKLFNFKQLITVPTRPSSGSLIDHIFVNDVKFVRKSGTLDISLSDHLPVFVNWKSRVIKPKNTDHNTRTFRPLRNFMADSFVNDLRCVPWNSLDMFTDPNDALDQWYCLFRDVLNLHAPVKQRRVKSIFRPEWFSDEIMDAIGQRNRLYNNATRNNLDSSWSNYRVARNKVIHLIRSAKRLFYRELIRNNLDNPKNLWRIIRNLAPSQNSNLPSHLTIDEKLYTNPKDIANLFNEYFTSIAFVIQPISCPSATNWDYLTDMVGSVLSSDLVFDIPPISEEFVLSSLQRLPDGKAAGLDGLNNYFLRISAPEIALSLTSIFNTSITTGVFPDTWKVAKVSPIFKCGSLFDRSNFRPISLLAVISKILERHIFTSYSLFLTEHQLLSDHQFGFRKSRSCELAVTELSDKILQNMDARLLNGLLLLDFKKAFDLVDHDILLFKLSVYGCSRSTVKWFSSYLTDRSQRVCFRGFLSDNLPVLNGVPQGSILGPLLFLLFVNDLLLYLSPHDTDNFVFADDTSLLASGATVREVVLKLNAAVAAVFKWAEQNRMMLNTFKSKCMLITTPQKFRLLPNTSLDVIVNDCQIEQVYQWTVLGTIFDSFLTWDFHVNNICSTVSNRLSLLRRIKPYLTYEGTLHFYNSCVHCYFTYCSSCWGTCSHTQLLRLLRLQKRAARILLDADYTQSSVSLFLNLKWLPISDVVKIRKILTLYSIILDPFAPFCYKQKFQFLSQHRSRQTRASTYNLIVPKPRSNSLKRTYGYLAPVLFNALDADLKQLAILPLTSSLQSRLLLIKFKLRAIFSSRLKRVDNLELLMCSNCKFCLFCNCVLFD